MTASRNVSLCYRVADLIADEVRRLPMGVAARMLNTSKPMISRLRAGQLSSVPVLLKAVEQFGLKILEPVVGSVDTASLARRLDNILAQVGDIRHAVQGTAAALAHPHGLSGAYQRDGEGEAGEAGGEGGHPLSRLALVQTRRSPSILAGDDFAQLRRHLSAFDNVVSLDAARALAKADNAGLTGLAYRKAGQDWTALVAPENRLWTPSHEERPISAFEGNVADLRGDLDEAARSRSPIVVTHAGALKRGDDLLSFNSHVVRIGGRAKCGAEMVLTDFCRRGAA